jgi:hypothetical protein
LRADASEILGETLKSLTENRKSQIPDFARIPDFGFFAGIPDFKARISD